MPETIDLLIVGAGPAGFSAARAFRAHGGRGRVVLLSLDPDAPYDRPPLSKGFLRGELLERDLPMAEPGELDDLEVDKRFGSAAALSPLLKVIRTTDGAELLYGTCILATGSAPSPLPISGADDPGVLNLRTIEDSRRLRAAGSASSTAVVIGSGFVGCEAASSLSRLGVRVRMVTDENAPHERRLGSEVASRVRRWLDDEGVDVLTSSDVTSIMRDSRLGHDQWAVTRAGAGDVRGDVVLVATGATPNGQIAARAGLKMEGSHVLTDARMHTSVAGVLAAGDVAMAYNRTAARHLRVEHWGEALRMGEIAGATAARSVAVEDEWSNVPGFWSQIGDRTLKYAAWGDGYHRVHVDDHDGGGFTAWYEDENGTAVGVLTHNADDDYERGQKLVEAGKPAPR